MTISISPLVTEPLIHSAQVTKKNNLHKKFEKFLPLQFCKKIFKSLQDKTSEPSLMKEVQQLNLECSSLLTNILPKAKSFSQIQKYPSFVLLSKRIEKTYSNVKSRKTQVHYCSLQDFYRHRQVFNFLQNPNYILDFNTSSGSWTDSYPTYDIDITRDTKNRIAYAALCGKSNIHLLDSASNSTYGLLHFREQLETFSKLKSLGAHDTKKIEEALLILRRLHFISEETSYKQPNEYLIALSIHIFKDLQRLPLPNKKEPSTYLISGGNCNREQFNLREYVTKIPSEEVEGHEILYEISRQSDGLYQFKITNTGSGIDENHKHVFSLHSHSLPSFGYRERIYHSLELKQLNPSFLLALLQMRTHNLNCSISTTYNHIRHHLYNGHNRKWGRQHRPQRFGTCWYKAISCWLRGFLGKALYQKYKVAMSRKVIEEFRKDNPLEKENGKNTCISQCLEKLKVLNKKIESSVIFIADVKNPLLIDEIHEVSDKILKKRIKKSRKIEKHHSLHLQLPNKIHL